MGFLSFLMGLFFIIKATLFKFSKNPLGCGGFTPFHGGIMGETKKMVMRLEENESNAIKLLVKLKACLDISNYPECRISALDMDENSDLICEECIRDYLKGEK